MATRLYLNDAVAWPDVTGTLPTGSNSTHIFSDHTWADATTLRSMGTSPGVAQVGPTDLTDADTNLHNHFIRFFMSRPLASNQTVGGGTVTINVADSESNTSANWVINNAAVYVWRPSTGAVVGTLLDGGSGQTTIALEATSASSEQTSINAWATTTPVSALAGDVIICEVWASVTNGMNTAYTVGINYDGATVTTVENTVVSDHAAFVELAETLTFTAPPASTAAMMSFRTNPALI
jgi:hypothetical protein